MLIVLRRVCVCLRALRALYIDTVYLNAFSIKMNDEIHRCWQTAAASRVREIQAETDRNEDAPQRYILWIGDACKYFKYVQMQEHIQVIV